MPFSDVWTKDPEPTTESTKRSGFREKVTSPEEAKKEPFKKDLRKRIQGKMKSKEEKKVKNNFKEKISLLSK